MPTADFSTQLEKTIAKIQNADEILNREKELILDYKRDQVLNGLSEATLLRNTQRLKIIAEQADKPFDDMGKLDVRTLIAWVHDQGYTTETVDTYKTVVKSFWGWLKNADRGEAPEEVKWIKLSNGNNNGTLPKDLLTKDEVEAR